MRASIVPALSLLLSGCVSFTTAGTEETIAFSGNGAAEKSNQAVLKPYNDLPLSIEFACPKKLATLSTFYVVPLPPVVPAGFINEKISYLHITMPQGTENAMAKARIHTPEGTALPLSDARQSLQAVSKDGTVETTYILNKECEALDGGSLEVAGLSYKDKSYPASTVRLEFDSRIKFGAGWWPPVLFNGGRALSGGTHATEPPR